MGFADQAHLSIPIDITPLKEQLFQAQKLSDKLLKLGNDNQGGLYSKALSLEQKYQTVVFYYTLKCSDFPRI